MQETMRILPNMILVTPTPVPMDVATPPVYLAEYIVLS